MCPNSMFGRSCAQRSVKQVIATFRGVALDTQESLSQGHTDVIFQVRTPPKVSA